MRFARGFLLALLLAWALWPERRYWAEHELHLASAVLRFVVTRPSEVADRAGALNEIAAIAASATKRLARDPRPWILEGNVRMQAGEPDRALDAYRQALALGERAETDLHLARAYEELGQETKAKAAYVRAAWVSPALLPYLLPDIARPVSEEVARLEAELKAGRLQAPPPLPLE